MRRRFLFVVPPLTGHVNPTISVAKALADRGHSCAWVGHPGTLLRLLPEGSQLLALDDDLPSDMVERVSARASALRGPERLKFLWEEFFIPLARAMRPGVDAAVEAFSPDVVVVDQQTLAGAVVAEARGLPWATSATTSAGLVDPLRGLPKVRAWLDRLMFGLKSEAGLSADVPIERSPHLVIGFTSRALLGGVGQLPAHFALVGPSFDAREERVVFPWRRLDPAKKKVLVTLGTVNVDAGSRFHREVMAVARQMDAQFILVAREKTVSDPPDNVIVRFYIPQLAVLAQVDAVLCHAGHNTVVEALAHGLPLVVAPIKDDQPVVAAQVVAAGAGVRVKFGRVRAPKLQAAIERVLYDEELSGAARRIQRSLAQAGGAERAAELLVRLA